MPDSPSRRPTQAHAREAPPPAERVQLIAEDMETGAWSRGRARHLAALWGLALNTVNHDSAEANRLLKSMTREQAQARVEAVIERAIAQSLTSPHGAGDLIRAAALLAKIYGLDRPQSGTSGQVASTTTDTSSGERPPPPPGFEEEPESDS